MVSSSSEPTIASVVTTDSAAAAKSATRIALSNRERALGVRVRLTRPPCAPAAAASRGSAIGLAPRQLGDLVLGLGSLLVGHRDDLGGGRDVSGVVDDELHERL